MKFKYSSYLHTPMKFKNSHKSMSITFFLTCVLLIILLNFSISLTKEFTEESFVEVIALDAEEEEEEEEKETSNSKSTNQAFNTAKNNKQLAHLHKTIEPPKDYENPLLKKFRENKDPIAKYEKSKGKSNTITHNELTAFNGVKGVLTRHSNSNPKHGGQESINKNSTIYYSLVGRTDKYLPVPIYLCESKGLVVVNITVNSSGSVINTSINSSSTTQNACLIDHAINYAKESRFSTSSKTKQLGTITFNFIGKNK